MYLAIEYTGLIISDESRYRYSFRSLRDMGDRQLYNIARLWRSGAMTLISITIYCTHSIFCFLSHFLLS